MNDDKEVKIDEVSIETPDVTPEPESANGTDTSKLDELTGQLSDLNDKYLRLAAELENTRRRSALDAESRARNRATGIIEKILPVMDAIDAALKHNPDDAGIQSMSMAMESAFNQIGISRIKSIGEKLNPQLHNAIQLIDAPSDANPRPESGTIIEEMQPGYMYGDNVLRTAMVVVCK